MSPELPLRARSIGGSATMGAAAAAEVHPDGIVLAVGEPAERPPDEVVEAAKRALAEGRTRYGPAAGLPELRARLAAEHAARTGVATAAEDVIVTAGGKPALMDALRCVLSPGDEVLVLAPYWPSFLQQVEWCGARPVVVPAGPGGLPEPARVEARCGPRTRVLVVNSPANPSARVFPPEVLRALGALAERRDLWLLSDEVYRDLALDGPAPGPVAVEPELAARTIVVESFSKRFAMTGYRLGAAIAPRPLVEAMTRLAAASTTHPSTIAQHAGVAALALDGAWERAQLARYRARRALCLAGLARIAGVTCPPAEAAFYLFPDVRGWLARVGLADDVALARALGAEAGVFLVPGTAFGAPGHLRLSYGLEEGRLAEACARLAAWPAARAV